MFPLLPKVPPTEEEEVVHSVVIYGIGKRTFPQSVFVVTKSVTWNRIVPMLPHPNPVHCVLDWIFMMYGHVQNQEFVLNVAFQDTLIESALSDKLLDSPNVWFVAFVFRVDIIELSVVDGHRMPPHKMQSALCVTRLDIFSAPR